MHVTKMKVHCTYKGVAAVCQQNDASKLQRKSRNKKIVKTQQAVGWLAVLRESARELEQGTSNKTRQDKTKYTTLASSQKQSNVRTKDVRNLHGAVWSTSHQLPQANWKLDWNTLKQQANNTKANETTTQ